MERIEFEIDSNDNVNIKEKVHLDYEPIVEKTILKKATKYYSYNRLEFNSEDDYKILTFKQDGKKHKLVVSQKESSELTKEDWKKISQKTHKNVILFHTVEHKKEYYSDPYSDTWEYYKKYYGPYMDILDSKNYKNRKRLKITYWLNKLLWLIIGLMIAPLINTSGILWIPFMIAEIKVLVGTFISFLDGGYSDETLFNFSLLIRVVEYPAYLISNAIGNVIGDIKNDRFIEGRKDTIEKINNAIKTVGNAIKEAFIATKDKIADIKESVKEKRRERKQAKKELNDSLSEIAKSMEEKEIKPKLYKLSTENIIGEVVEFNDSYVERSKKQIKIATKQIKDPGLSEYYSKRLDEVCDHYKKNRNTESDIVKSVIISEFKRLKEDLEKYIIISNNQTEIDTYLEELKEEANQYRKARQ